MRKQIDKSKSLITLVPAYTVAFSVSVLFTSLAYATPSGGKVVAGDATISQSTKLATINQRSNVAIINWQKVVVSCG